MKKLSFLVILFFYQYAYGQENCKVLMKDIDSIYNGTCKRGLADGIGEAWGKFYYIGKFRKGLPDGMGKMDYKDGSVYSGYWRNGVKNGKGRLSFKKAGKDTSISETWKSGKKIEVILMNVDYKILKEQTPDRLKVFRTGDGNKVYYRIKDYGSSTVSNLFISGSSGSEFSYTRDIGFMDINFPFLAKIRFETWNAVSTQRIEVEVNVEIIKPGEWIIDIR